MDPRQDVILALRMNGKHIIVRFFCFVVVSTIMLFFFSQVIGTDPGNMLQGQLSSSTFPF